MEVEREKNTSSLARHVVDDSIRIDSHTCSAASIDHGSELSPGTLTTGKLVADGLVTAKVSVEDLRGSAEKTYTKYQGRNWLSGS